MYDKTRLDTDPQVLEKFNKHLETIPISHWSEVDSILVEKKCDILYVIKYGTINHQISKKIKTVIQCVFNCSYEHSHGDVYASVSPFVKGNLNGVFHVVPHMINLPEVSNNFRNIFNIPKEAIVFGRYGGYGQFDIPYVQRIVEKVAKNNKNIFFIFANTAQFCEQLDNIIHMNKIVDLEKKVQFINTCDAMIWGRSDGETFGLSIVEFSIKNKPVFATNCGDNAHVHLLGNKGIWYNESTLYDLLTNFKLDEKKDWNAYREYLPEKVMQIFKTVFID